MSFFPSLSQHDVSVRKACLSLLAVVDIMYQGDMCLTAEEQQRLQHHLLRFGRRLQVLASYSQRVTGELLWIIIPKCHWFQHLAEQSRLINPKYCQNYLEEGAIGKFSDLMASCANGPQSSEAQQVTALWKYLVGIHLRCKGLDA